METTPQEKIEEIKKRVNEGLYFNRVPNKTKTEFIAWAKEEFCDDRGLAFKWLWDFYQGTLSTSNSILSEQIEILANEIEQLKAVPKEVGTKPTEKKVIKSVSGRIITERGE